MNAAAEEVLRKYGVYSPFKNYPGPYPYPASTCVSVNEELVHGIPSKARKLKEGDIVTVDCGTVYQGFVADSAFTAGVGELSETARKLLEVTEGALYEGIRNMMAENRIGDISAAIQRYVESRGFPRDPRVHRAWRGTPDARRPPGAQLWHRGPRDCAAPRDDHCTGTDGVGEDLADAGDAG